MKSQDFSKITETARLPCTELGTDNSQYGGYSYWMFWIGGLSWRFSASSFCDFWKMTFCNFTVFLSFLTKATLWFSDVLHEENQLICLCPNMIHFDGVDFSERRSEEVLSFFWRSVYHEHWEAKPCKTTEGTGAISYTSHQYSMFRYGVG